MCLRDTTAKASRSVLKLPEVYDTIQSHYLPITLVTHLPQSVSRSFSSRLDTFGALPCDCARFSLRSLKREALPHVSEVLMLAKTDCVLIITDHDAVDYGLIGEHAGLVVDTRNAMARVPEDRVSARVVKA